MIYFHVTDCHYRIKDKRKIRAWIKEVVVSEKRSLGNLNIILGSDEYVLKINQTHLGHNYYTDVLTFDLSEESDEISGDIYISLNRIKENALEYKVQLHEELKRVIIHGVLHLIGFNDKTRKQKTEMRQKEDFYLSKSF